MVGALATGLVGHRRGAGAEVLREQLLERRHVLRLFHQRGAQRQPEPVFVGSNLVYSINVTNFGPNTAKNTVMSEILPQNVVFVSASISQGSISQSGGIVTGNFGNITAVRSGARQLQLAVKYVF